MKTTAPLSTVGACLSRTFLCSALFAGVLFAGGIAQAQDTWTGGGSVNAPNSGTWDTSTTGNWSTAGAWQNSTSTTAVFGGATTATPTVTVGAAITANSLQFTSTTDNYTLSATSLQGISLTNTTGSLTGGSIQIATSVTATIGTNVGVQMLGQNMDIDGVSGTAGTLNIYGTVADFGTETTRDGSISIGIDDGVTVQVNAGGTLLSSAGNIKIGANGTGSTGTVIVNGGLVEDGGANSQIEVGAGQTGTDKLTINSGVVDSNELNLNSAGTAVVSLNGGILEVGPGAGVDGIGIHHGAGVGYFFFNGGTLKMGTTDMVNLTGVYVGGTNGVGGAVINSGNGEFSYTITIDQALLTGTGIAGSNAGTIDGGLLSEGSGTLILTGANTYTGGTTISCGVLGAIGILSVNNQSGSATGSGAVYVTAGGMLGGGNTAASGGTLVNRGHGAGGYKYYQAGVQGIISGAVKVASGGILAPGNNSVGTLTMGGLTLVPGSILDYEFNSTASSNDFISVTDLSGLALDGAGFNLYQEGTTNPFDTAGVYDLIGYTGGDTGSVSDLSVLNEQAGFDYTFVDTGSLIQLDIVAAPEPGTWALMLGGLGVLFIMQVCRRRNS